MTAKTCSKVISLLARAASSDYATLGEIAVTEGTNGPALCRIARRALAEATRRGGNWREVRAEAAQMVREGWRP